MNQANDTAAPFEVTEVSTGAEFDALVGIVSDALRFPRPKLQAWMEGIGADRCLAAPDPRSTLQTAPRAPAAPRLSGPEQSPRSASAPDRNRRHGASRCASPWPA